MPLIHSLSVPRRPALPRRLRRRAPESGGGRPHVALCLVFILTLIAAPSSAQPEPDRGVVAHLAVKGDLDSRLMADEIVNWLARRDPVHEILAVMVFDAPRARPDLATRIAEAVRTSQVPVAVHLDARGPVEPQILLIGLCARSVTASSGVTIVGDETTGLPGLCPPTDSGWRGASERLARSVIAGRDELLLDLFVPPLGSVYLLTSGQQRTLAREPIDKEDQRIVARTNDDEWRVRLGREELLGLSLATGADGLGEVLRICNVRAFRRERAEIRSGLGSAQEQIGAIRAEVATRIVQLKEDVREYKSLDERDRVVGLIDAMWSLVHDTQDQLDAARGLFERFPELYRLSPPWAFDTDPDTAGKEWTNAFESLVQDLDDLRSQIDALERP